MHERPATALPHRRITHPYLLPVVGDYHVADGITEVARNDSTDHTLPAEANDAGPHIESTYARARL